MAIADIFWARFEKSPWRAIISHGLAPAIVGLVWSSVWTISRGTPAGPIPYAVTAIVAILMLRTKLSAPVLIAASGVVGIVALR
jgi:chromate transporter